MRAVLSVLLFLIGYSLTGFGLYRVLPPYQVPIVSPKMDWLAQHADDYDVLFVGSSRTFRQIVPEVFEADMAAAGHPVRAFNLGVDGMRPPEDTYLLEKALAMRTKPLKIVLVECNSIRFKQREDDRDSVRAVYWHDWTSLATIYRRALAPDGKKRRSLNRLNKLAEAVPDFYEHFVYWLWNNSNQGRGHELLFKGLGLHTHKPPPLSDLGERNDGYQTPSKVELMPPENWKKYEQTFAKMQAKAAEEKAKAAAETDPKKKGKELLGVDPASVEEVRRKVRLVEKAGGRVFLVVPPVVGDDPEFLKLMPGLPPVFDFSDPEKYPQLFEPKYRNDTGHTNFAGAKIYTHLIVSKLLPFLKPTAP